MFGTSPGSPRGRWRNRAHLPGRLPGPFVPDLDAFTIGVKPGTASCLETKRGLTNLTRPLPRR
eukprot:8317755-Lingulodinium_polyedra.AAC.1